MGSRVASSSQAKALQDQSGCIQLFVVFFFACCLYVRALGCCIQASLQTGSVVRCTNPLRWPRFRAANRIRQVEQQIVELQRSHDTRFADMHKDLAGIVWELSKLRADMARWQASA